MTRANLNLSWLTAAVPGTRGRGATTAEAGTRPPTPSMSARNKPMKILTTVLAMTACVCPIAALAAGPLEGKKDVVLNTRDGQTMMIGTVSFTPKGDRTGFDLQLDPSKFQQFFLSMKEFKCVEGAEIFCHVPYTDPDTVTATDLSWLEHRLIFFFKQPADYGAKLTNGIIYTMKINDGSIVGTPQGIDLNAIAAPPSDLTVAPYPASERYNVEPGARWIQSITIADHR
jgi:hypothetical protein